MRNHEYLSRADVEQLGFAALGEDVRIHPSCVFVGCERISIGSHVRIDPFCIITIGGRLVIGDHVHISGHTSLVGGGPIEIGDHANISHGAKVLSSSDHFSAAGIAGPLVPDAYRQVDQRPVSIGRHAIVGAGSVILPGGLLGEGTSPRGGLPGQARPARLERRCRLPGPRRGATGPRGRRGPRAEVSRRTAAPLTGDHARSLAGGFLPWTGHAVCRPAEKAEIFRTLPDRHLDRVEITVEPGRLPGVVGQ